MSTPKISVITSLFRCEKYLDGYMNALKEISNPDEVEVFLLHNEPSEIELNVIKQHLADVRATVNHVIISQRESLYKTWNRGIELAKGKYIAVWNVDDVRTPNSLNLQSSAMDSSDAQLCYGNYIGVQNYGSRDGIEYCFPSFTTSVFLRSCYLTPFPMWRKSLHDLVGFFDEGFISAGDYDFQLRAARAGKFVKVESCIGYYLEAPETGISKTGNINNIERTVCELRYGIFDKIDALYIRSALKYSLTKLIWNNGSHSIGRCFNSYAQYIASRILIAPLMLFRIPINLARFTKHRVLPKLKERIQSFFFTIGKQSL